MRRIAALLVLVAALIAGLLALRTSSASSRSAALQERAEGSRSDAKAESKAVSGVVLDAESKEPVPKARVTLYHLAPDGPTATAAATFVTDDAGRFSAPPQREEDWCHVVVEADGYPPHREWFDPGGMEIRLARGDEMTFAIVDDEGRPAAGAEVLLYADWRVCLATVQADAQGMVTVRLAEGSGISLLVRYAGCAYEDRERGATGFVLSPGFSIGGTVVDSANQPVPGALVRLRQGSGCKNVSEYEPMLLTGSDGRFLFLGIHGCTCEMTVRAEGYCEVLRCPHPGDEEVRVVLMRPASVSGTVVMPDGSPAPNASVRPDWSYEGRVAVRTDADGRFRIDALLPRKQQVHAFADPGLRASVVVTPPESGTEEVRIVLRPSPRSYIRVHVTDERGRAVPGVKVIRHLWRADAETDPEGFAAVALDEPETDVKLYLVPDKEGRPRLCESEIEARTSPLPGDARVVEAVLREGVLVGLDARAPDGTPVPQPEAWFFGGDSDAAEDKHGWRVDPADTYQVRVWAPGFLDTTVDGWTFATAGPSIRVTLRPCATVRGRVVDANGAPLAHLHLALDPGLETGRTSLDWQPDGSFLLEGLAEGGGRLVFSREAYGTPEAAAQVRTVSGKITDVGTLTFVPPAVLTGTVVDSSGRPLGGAWLRMVGIPDFWEATYSHADGTFRAVVPAFLESDLVVRKGGFGTVRRSVAPGPARPVGEIVLPAHGSLEVDVDGVGQYDSVMIDVVWPGGIEVGNGSSWQPDRQLWRIDDLAPGRYLVRVSLDDRVLEQEVEIAAGETASVRLGVSR